MRGSHKVIRHAYNNVLSASARLISFATGIPTASRDQLINVRQGILAADDLVTFAVYARRLIENTESHKQFSKVFITTSVDGGKLQIPITTIINKLIHHKYNRDEISEEEFLDLHKHKNIRHFHHMCTLNRIAAKVPYLSFGR
jgi:hypothetical protein